MTSAQKLERLIEIGRYLLDEFHLSDCVYEMRERVEEIEEGASTWDHPSVVQFGEMVAELELLVRPDGTVKVTPQEG